MYTLFLSVCWLDSESANSLMPPQVLIQDADTSHLLTAANATVLVSMWNPPRAKHLFPCSLALTLSGAQITATWCFNITTIINSHVSRLNKYWRCSFMLTSKDSMCSLNCTSFIHVFIYKVAITKCYSCEHANYYLMCAANSYSKNTKFCLEMICKNTAILPSLHNWRF